MSNAAIGLVRQGFKLGFCFSQARTHLFWNSNFFKLQSYPEANQKFLHMSHPSCGLMELFDDEKNWGEDIIRVGRSWKMEELRLKSNSDLHKLWYVLLKERNMLMTMEHEYKEAYEPFPNPERLDKVKESMHNLEEVVIERNRAYHELETGESGIRPAKEEINQLGIPFFHRMAEHVIPKYVNTSWKKTHVFKDNYQETKLFHALLEEKRQSCETRRLRGIKKHVLGLMRRFPDLDLEAVKEKFPEVDVDKLKDSHEARGHWLP